MITSYLRRTTFRFPVGELQVSVENRPPQSVDIAFTFQKNEEIIELLLFVDAAIRQGHTLGTLLLPYVPFSRQDRCNAPGEAFSLAVFAKLINSLGFRQVLIHDPHSDVTPALIDRCTVIEQAKLLYPLIRGHATNPFYLVSPDAGAIKKTYKLAQELDDARCRGVIEAGKIRDTNTGAISGTVVHADYLSGIYDYYVVDDICDGGRTFIELAKVLKEKGAVRIHLVVTHGFFTKGREVLEDLFTSIHAVHNYDEKEPE